ncbi:hypothetical protein HPULCUR_003042 [Helicostylum pulchrum]|uniref:Uncharacterized protein n=1 Tax=Helicostylum pulchrum TaxID=562976 RepID=A0ABP9XSG1_9FUNG
MRKEYAEMVDEFGELFSFLMDQGRSIANRDLGTRWTYNVMRGSVYSENVNRFRQRFPSIKPYFRSFNLLVLFQEPHARQYHGTKEEYYGLTERLTNEIQECYRKNTLPKEDYVIREEIVNFVSERFQEIFNEQDLSVELIGSLHNKLALTDGFISMSIRLPQSYFREDALLCDNANWKDTVYDVYYLAKCLRELGMEATLPIPLGKRTKFTHNISKIPCSIGVDGGLLFERDFLISEYNNSKDDNYEACTIWNSENDDNMAALLISFMDYCARVKNYKDVSIVNGGKDYAGLKENEVNKDDAWIQDPFLPQKNIARGCKFYTLKNISETFNYAVNKLKQGSSLQDICDMDTYINKN